MTTEATLQSFALSPDFAISRFFKALKKPEWTMLAGKFVGGLATGAFSGWATALGIWPTYLYGLPKFPVIVDRFIDRLFEDDLQTAPDRLSPEKMQKWSTIAAFSGSIIGYAAAMVLETTHLHNTHSKIALESITFNVDLGGGIFISLLSANIDLHKKRKGPGGPSPVS